MEYICKNNGSYKIYNSKRLQDAIASGKIISDEMDLTTLKTGKKIYKIWFYKKGSICPAFYRVYGSNVFYKKCSQAIWSDWYN